MATNRNLFKSSTHILKLLWDISDRRGRHLGALGEGLEAPHGLLEERRNEGSPSKALCGGCAWRAKRQLTHRDEGGGPPGPRGEAAELLQGDAFCQRLQATSVVMRLLHDLFLSSHVSWWLHMHAFRQPFTLEPEEG
jgi:hypothetical protein